MARPAKQGMDYFPHDTDAASDEKVESLRILYGNDGYAFYFILLERIYRTADFELDVSDAETRQILARKVEVTPQKFEDMLNSALKRGCFDASAYAERKVLTSSGIKKRADTVVSKRQKMASAYSNRVSSAETPPETQQKEGFPSREKESKGKERKEEESKEEPSSLRSEDAATAAAPAQKKIEGAEEFEPESPAPPQTKPPVAKPPRRPVLAGPLAELLNVGGAAHEVQALKKPLTQDEADKLVAEFGAEAAAQIVQEMANYAKLRNYTSVNLTARNWLSKRQVPAFAPPAQQPQVFRQQPVSQVEKRQGLSAQLHAKYAQPQG